MDEDPHVKSWEDGQYNIMNMSIEETYGFGILNEGQAIAVAKNVKVRPNEFVMPARTGFNLGVFVLPKHNASRAGEPAAAEAHLTRAWSSTSVIHGLLALCRPNGKRQGKQGGG